MPTKILMLSSSFPDILLQDAYIIFQNSVNNFEVEHKMAKFWFGVKFPLNILKYSVSWRKRLSCKHFVFSFYYMYLYHNDFFK